MSDVRPIRWVGSAALEAAQRATEACLANWAEDWGLTPAGSCVAAPLDHAGAAHLLASADTRGFPGSLSAFVNMSPSWPTAMRGGLFRRDTGGSAIAEHVAGRAHEALLAALGTSLASKQTSRAAEAAQPGTPGHWGACVRVVWLDCEWRLLMHWALLSQRGWVPPRAKPPTLRWAPETTLAPLVVPLQAVVGSAAVEVRDLMSLEAGDVLVLGQPAERPIELRASGLPLRFEALLGTLGQLRAAQVVAHIAATARSSA